MTVLVRSHRFTRRTLRSWGGPVGKHLPAWSSCDTCGQSLAKHAYQTAEHEERSTR
jgi:hypothetical protein